MVSRQRSRSLIGLGASQTRWCETEKLIDGKDYASHIVQEITGKRLL